MLTFPPDERPADGRPILAFDTGSPTVSVALVARDSVLAELTLDQRAAGQGLIAAAQETLREAGCALSDLGGLAVLRGPGSFTGLRIGLATAIGLNQATGLPVAAVSTFRALAAAGTARSSLETGSSLVAAVDALRDEWSVQRFFAGMPPRPEGPSELVSAPALDTEGAPLVGFDLAASGVPKGATLIEPGPLAVWVARLALHVPDAWDQSLLTRPLYARPPAASSPRRTSP